uniref:FHA domain-containing protein n=1 Tax=Panagrolaimus sp. ES5 TaxID=591445 RepID=A0AC34G9L7_9BILA
MYQQIAADYAFDPILIPLDSAGHPIPEKAIPLRHGITEIGSDPRVSSFIIRDPSIRPKHCIINFSDGLVSVTPLEGILEVNGLRAETTQQLRDGFVLRIGGEHAFRFHLSQRQNLPSSTANYANSPIFQRAPSSHHS